MKTLLIATIALTLAAPAFAGNKLLQEAQSTVVDSLGNPVITKDQATVSVAEGAATIAPAADAADAAQPAPAAKAKHAHKAKHGKKKAYKGKHKKGHKAKHGKRHKAVATPSVTSAPAESLIRTRAVEKR